MVFVEKCFCCSLLIASGFFGVYLLIAYLIAFAFELIWIILESSHALPTGAILLVIEYSAMSLFTSLLLHGLTTKNTFCLIGWMFAVTILTFPEAGLVIYMSVDYWGTEHIYGMTELSCWLIRIIVNIVQVILIHSLHTIWKDDELISNRLREITSEPYKSGVGGGGGSHLPPLNSHYYQNNGYEHSMDLLNVNSDMKRYGSMPDLWNRPFADDINLMPYHVPYSGGCQFATPNEFNTRMFTPPPPIHTETNKKTQSLLDLRFLDPPNSMSYAQQWLSENILRNNNNNLILPPLAQPQQPRAKSEMNYPNYNNHNHHQYHHQIKSMTRCQSMDTLNTNSKDTTDNTSHIIRNHSGFYAQPMESYGVPIYYGPLDGPDFLIYKKQIEKLTSRNSLSNNSADDVQKYRDVVL